MTTLTESACGSTFQVGVSEVFAVELEENPTTGYRWNFTADAGVDEVSSSYAVNAGGGVGGAGVRQFLFRAATQGQFVIRGSLCRSWQGDASAIKRCEITVRSSQQ
jgi:inhibitor of cysteine peptidase